MASLATISKGLGLSKATVSRAFDPRFADLVRPATRKRIFDFCREHDYHPSLIGRSFSTGRTFKIGVISTAATDKNFTMFSASLFAGITAAAIERNYTPLLLDMNETPAFGIDLINSCVADAYIINSTTPNEQLQELFIHKNVPVIVFETTGIPMEGLPVLFRDIRPAYRQLWRNLPPEDRDRTAFIGRGLTSGKWRDLQKSAPRGVTVDPILISEKAENFLFHRDSARGFAEKELDRLLKYKLLWCSSDLVALGICDTLKRHGIEPGKDIYLVGFDNLEATMGDFPESGLTTIDPGWTNGGHRLVEMLLDSLDSGRALPTRTPWYPEAVYRKTFPEIIVKIQSKRT